ncbi:MAG: LacI family transcriptional regulator, partial [Actinomycetota bacterium]
MKRRILAVILAASLALVLAACAEVRESGGNQGGGEDGGSGQQGPIELAVVPKAVGFDFWETVRKGAVCAAQKAEGEVEVQWDGVTAETDVNGQVNLL